MIELIGPPGTHFGVPEGLVPEKDIPNLGRWSCTGNRMAYWVAQIIFSHDLTLSFPLQPLPFRSSQLRRLGPESVHYPRALGNK